MQMAVHRARSMERHWPWCPSAARWASGRPSGTSAVYFTMYAGEATVKPHSTETLHITWRAAPGVLYHVY